jgi:hypothetical protein
LASDTRSGRLVAFATSKEAGLTDPKDKEQEGEDLDLDAETVRDLEPDEGDAENVEGGRAAMCSGGCPTASDCP